MTEAARLSGGDSPTDSNMTPQGSPSSLLQTQPLPLDRPQPRPARRFLSLRCVPNATVPTLPDAAEALTPRPGSHSHSVCGRSLQPPRITVLRARLGGPPRKLRSHKRPFVSPSGAERGARRTGSADTEPGGSRIRVQRGRPARGDSAGLSEGPSKEQGSPRQEPRTPSLSPGSPSAPSRAVTP